MKFFLGSVPFGCDNIGDEAILEAIVKILRSTFLNPRICVATAKPSETAKLLDCKAVGLLGFGSLDKNPQQTIEAIKESDVYIWAGATGLSDYPEAALVGLEVAQKFCKKTVIWNVGMDDKFNPALFELRGKKKFLCDIATKLCFNCFDFKKFFENRKQRAVKVRLKNALKKCTLVCLRDAQSLECIRKFAEIKNAYVGADSALILRDYTEEYFNVLPEITKNALLSDSQKIGLCVSSQRKIKNLDALASAFDKFLDGEKRKLFLIPMNEKTDLPLMKKIFENVKNKENIFPLDCINERRAVMAVVSKCSVVVSSRLHLLILSANVGTPIVGIARGSKIANFLHCLKKEPVGSVSQCDFDKLISAINCEISNKNSFKETCSKAYNTFYSRLEECKNLLSKLK